MASGLSSVFEAQADALFNTIWWTADQKFGYTNRLKATTPDTFLGRVRRQARMTWENVCLRALLFYFVPQVLALAFGSDKPGQVGAQMAFLSVIGPWIYHIFVYTWLIDPLRHLPSPKAYPFV